MDNETAEALKRRLELSKEVIRANAQHIAKVAAQGDVVAVLAAIDSAIHYGVTGEELTAKWAYERAKGTE